MYFLNVWSYPIHFSGHPTTRYLVSHVPNKKEIAHAIWLICKKFNEGLLSKEWARSKEIMREDIVPPELTTSGKPLPPMSLKVQGSEQL